MYEVLSLNNYRLLALEELGVLSTGKSTWNARFFSRRACVSNFVFSLERRKNETTCVFFDFLLCSCGWAGIRSPQHEYRCPNGRADGANGTPSANGPDPWADKERYLVDRGARVPGGRLPGQPANPRRRKHRGVVRSS